MLSSLAESFIQKVCGRYLKNFTTNNVSVSITGSITLTNIELCFDDCEDFQLPYKPIRGFIGTLKADLPLVPGSKFDVYGSDILIVSMRNDQSFDDEAIVHRAVQMWIGLLYTGLQDVVIANSKVSSSEFELSLTLYEKLVLTLERVHVRLEDEFNSHVPCPVGSEIISLGAILDKIELRSPTTSEITLNPDVYTRPSNIPTKSTITISKTSQVTNLSIYGSRNEDPLSNISDNDFTIELVKQQFYHRINSIHSRNNKSILNPISLNAYIYLIYQRDYQTFGPVRISTKQLDNQMNINVTLNDELLAYATNVIDTLYGYARRLQLSSRGKLCQALTTTNDIDTKRRAKLRWRMIRDSIRQDMWRYSKLLIDGSIRWRLWFEQWRLASRYIALREILMYHVGFEPKLEKSVHILDKVDSNIDKNNQNSLMYTFGECLLYDHLSISSATDSTIEVDRKKRRYQGQGVFPMNIIKAADILINKKTQLIGFNLPNAEASIDPLALSIQAVRALYSLQLELDAILPMKISALCRIWAEERYRYQITNGLNNLVDKKIDISIGSTIDSETIMKPIERNIEISLLLGLVDGLNFHGTFGSSKVEAYCTIQLIGWDSESNAFYTEPRSSTVGVGSNTALISWGQIFTIPINLSKLFDNITNKPISNTSIRIDIHGVGLFATSYGHITIPLSTFINLPHYQSIQLTNDTIIASEINEHNVLVSRKQDQTNDPLAITLRLVSQIIIQSDNKIKLQNISKLQQRINESIKDKQIVIERQEKITKREGNNIDNDDDRNFILDPSIITVQDLNLTVDLPSINILIEGIYHTPTSIRALAYADQGILLHHSIAIPLITISIKNIHTLITASNNPWIGESRVLIDELRIVNHARIDNKLNDFIPLLNMKSISCVLIFNQISTMSRYISGLLDPSCFDWTLTTSMYPFTISIHSNNHSSISITDTNIWLNQEILSHLLYPIHTWSIGTSNSSYSYDYLNKRLDNQVDEQEDQELDIRNHIEAIIRYGDNYTDNPKYLNSVRSIVGRVKHADSKGDNQLVLPQQTSQLSIYTTSQRLDIDISINNPNINDLYIDSNITNESIISTSISNESTTQSSTGFFDWIGGSTNTTVTKTTSSIGNKKNEQIDNWVIERNILLDRIKELELKNKILEEELVNSKKDI